MLLLILCISLFTLLSIIGLNSKDFEPSFGRARPEELVEYLLSSSIVLGTQRQIPKYKFYSELIADLILYRNRYGCEISDSLREIRKSLTVDIREEKKLKDSLLGGVFQYLFLASFLWIFLYFASDTIEKKLFDLNSFFVLLWQLVGLISYMGLYHYLKQSMFNPFFSYLRAIYKIRIMLEASRPLNEITKEVNFSEYKAASDMKYLTSRVSLIFKQIKQRGSISPKEFEYTIREIWDLFEIKLLQFNKYLNLIKLLLMLLFIIPTFFFNMFTILETLSL